VAPTPDIHNAEPWLRAIADDLRDYAEGEREATPGALYRLAATLDDICERAIILPRRHTSGEPACGETTGSVGRYGRSFSE
jgi:hypothetical protein